MVFKKGQTLEQMLCKFRPRIPKELSKDNIYLKNCTGCSSNDIGESGQTLKHIRDNPGHEIDWEN